MKSMLYGSLYGSSVLVASVVVMLAAGCGSQNDHPAMGNHPDMRIDPANDPADPTRLGGPHGGLSDEAPHHDALTPTR